MIDAVARNILNSFPVETDHVFLEDEYSLSRLYRVEEPSCDGGIYILDCVEGVEISCHPSIVGDRLRDKCLVMASYSCRFIKQKYGMQDIDYLILVDILRGGPGYRIAEPLKNTFKNALFRRVKIRPRYVEPSYMDHSGEKKLMVERTDFKQMPKEGDALIIMPDTVASGRTMKTCLEVLFERLGNLRVSSIVIYGFISEKFAHEVQFLEVEYGIPIGVVGIENLTGLSDNNYTMPYYGYDPYYNYSFERRLGCITSADIIEGICKEYVPSMDEPGDWNTRHTEPEISGSAGIRTHLESSRAELMRILRMAVLEPYQRSIALKELKEIERLLSL